MIGAKSSIIHICVALGRHKTMSSGVTTAVNCAGLAAVRANITAPILLAPTSFFLWSGVSPSVKRTTSELAGLT